MSLRSMGRRIIGASILARRSIPALREVAYSGSGWCPLLINSIFTIIK